jgi:hypothetical protein
MTVTRIEQENGTCLAACVAMTLGHFEIPAEHQNAIQPRLIDRNLGIASEVLAKTMLEGNGLTTRFASGLSLIDLRQICQGGVAICVVTDPTEMNGNTHVVVVDRVSDTAVHVVNSLADALAGDLATGDVPGDREFKARNLIASNGR